MSQKSLFCRKIKVGFWLIGQWLTWNYTQCLHVQSFSVNLLWKCCIYNSNNEAYVNYFLWLFTPNYSVVWHYGIIRKCGQSSRYFSIWKTLLQAHGVLDSFAIFFCSLSLKQKWGPVYRTLYYNHLHKPFIWRKHSITVNWIKSDGLE